MTCKAESCWNKVEFFLLMLLVSIIVFSFTAISIAINILIPRNIGIAILFITFCLAAFSGFAVYIGTIRCAVEALEEAQRKRIENEQAEFFFKRRMR